MTDNPWHDEVIHSSTPHSRGPLKVSLHPSSTRDVIVVMYPGMGGDIRGYQDKYVKLAHYMAITCTVGCVVRMGNRICSHAEYADSVIDDLSDVVDACQRRASEWFGVSARAVYLMGFSAGAGAVAAVSGMKNLVSRVLLVAPSLDARANRIRNGLSHFHGRVYVVVGMQDDVVGPDAAEFFLSMATSATTQMGFQVPDCDHQFRGARNGRILASLPLWAFADAVSEPHQAHGIELY